jgi:thiazole synthase
MLKIAGKEYNSRLLVGTGKYPSNQIAKEAIAASGAEIVTFAVRRVNLAGEGEKLTDVISPKDYTFLPNTAGCYTAEDAIRTLRLARELLDGHNLVKLEVIGDERTLYPDVIETLKAAQILVNDGFEVMAYTTDDILIAKELEKIGCVAIMPLAAPIGSGLGIQNPLNIRYIIENANVPVLVDAGVGTASDAAIAMELGCDAILINTAIAKANNPVMMAEAMKHSVIAGRLAYEAGRMGKSKYANASSPLSGIII